MGPVGDPRGEAFPDWKWQTSFPYFQLPCILWKFPLGKVSGLLRQCRGCPILFCFQTLKKWYANIQDTAGALKKINENQLSIEMWICGGHGSSPKRVILRAVAAEPCSIRGSKAGAAWSNLRFPHLLIYNMLWIIDVSNTLGSIYIYIRERER
jgi:hypothetical protein